MRSPALHSRPYAHCPQLVLLGLLTSRVIVVLDGSGEPRQSVGARGSERAAVSTARVDLRALLTSGSYCTYVSTSLSKMRRKRKHIETGESETTKSYEKYLVCVEDFFGSLLSA